MSYFLSVFNLPLILGLVVNVQVGENMKHIGVFFIALIALCTSCTHTYRDTSLYQRSGRAKPIVAVLPTIDSSTREHNLCWDLAFEMTEEVRHRVFDSPKLYLLREAGGVEIAHQLNAPNLKTLPKSATEHLGAAEFVIVTELLDQMESPYGLPSGRARLDEVGSLLSLAMRVRVVDIRGPQPKVILQEVISHDHPISRAYLNADYVRAHWGTEAFERTPMGMAHSKLIREVVARVEGYVGACKG